MTSNPQLPVGPGIRAPGLLANCLFGEEKATETWAAEEFEGAALGNGRLNTRLIKLVERLADQPTASIPGACADWAETQAAYRFFEQSIRKKQGLGWEDVLDPHMKRTELRMQRHPVVLCLQDTTELDFNGQRIAGLGPLSFEAQRGMYLHPTYAVTPSREPLGLLDAWMWSREPKDSDGQRSEPLESLRWIEGDERLSELAPHLPTTRLVYVADREADILALMQRAHALGTPVDWLLRSQHDRALLEGGKLWACVQETAVLCQIEFTLPARPGQTQRQVRQEIGSRLIELRPAGGGRFEVTCLIAGKFKPRAASSRSNGDC